MNRVLMASWLAGAIVVSLLVVRGHTQKPKLPNVRTDNVRAFMHRKLDHAKKLLEGLAVEDYDQIAKSAQALSLLSLESTWQVIQTPAYVDQSGDFRQLLSKLRKAARAKNLDGATLAYVGMTLQCVRCHRYMRSGPKSRTKPATKKGRNGENRVKKRGGERKP